MSRNIGYTPEERLLETMQAIRDYTSVRWFNNAACLAVFNTAAKAIQDYEAATKDQPEPRRPNEVQEETGSD